MQELSTVWFAWDWTDYLFELIVFPIALITLLIGVGLIKSEEKETGFGCLFAAHTLAMLPLSYRFVNHYFNTSNVSISSSGVITSNSGGEITGILMTTIFWFVASLFSSIIFGGIILGIMKFKEQEVGCGLVCLLFVVLFLAILIAIFLARNEIWDFVQDFVNVSSTISIIFIVIIIYIFITLF